MSHHFRRKMRKRVLPSPTSSAKSIKFKQIAHSTSKLIRDGAHEIRSKWRKVVTGDEKKRIRDLIREKETEPKYIKLFDKIGFTFGVLNILVCLHFLQLWPSYFWLWYSVVMSTIMATRIYHFSSLGWQYFLLDFCYFTIFCTFLNIFLFPNSPTFSKMCFIFSNGPLTTAILVWRNSFVFHDYDRITSVYIHILPAMLSYCSRWAGHSSIRLTLHPESMSSFLLYFWCMMFPSQSCPRPSLLSLRDSLPFSLSSYPGLPLSHPSLDTLSPLSGRDYLVGAGVYLFWQALYYLKTEVLDKKKLDANPHLLTSLRWLSKDTKNPTARLVLRALRAIGLYGQREEYDSTSLKTKLSFILSQFLYSCLTVLPTPLLYLSLPAQALYILFIFTSSVFNGASFYIDVFAERYHKQFHPSPSLSPPPPSLSIPIPLPTTSIPVQVLASTNNTSLPPAPPSPSPSSSPKSSSSSPRTKTPPYCAPPPLSFLSSLSPTPSSPSPSSLPLNRRKGLENSSTSRRDRSGRPPLPPPSLSPLHPLPSRPPLSRPGPEPEPGKEEGEEREGEGREEGEDEWEEEEQREEREVEEEYEENWEKEEEEEEEGGGEGVEEELYIPID